MLAKNAFLCVPDLAAAIAIGFVLTRRRPVRALADHLDGGGDDLADRADARRKDKHHEQKQGDTHGSCHSALPRPRLSRLTRYAVNRALSSAVR